MNILFLGNFEAEYSSENYYLKTFEKLGHTVIKKQEGKCHYNFLMSAYENNKIDLFFWVHTHGWGTPGIDQFLLWLREKKITSCAYHLDLYMGIQREVELFNDPFFKVDHFFTVDPQMARWLNEQDYMKYAKGHFLPAGVFETECVQVPPDRHKYPHEIIFTGSKGYHPEWPYRPQLIDWLHDTYGERFGHYGGGGKPGIRGLELNQLYTSAKIVIGDTLCKDFNYPYYSSDRLFEVIGRGGFMIYPKIKGLEDFYDHQDDIIYYPFGDFETLKSLIDFYLLHDDLRNIIRNRGFWRTKKEHTYTHRIQSMLGTLEKHRNENA